jgi:DNA (cytosine-5)-methyltransferase 1
LICKGDPHKVSKTKHHFIDLFAGCGGLSLGLEQSGFEPILVNELAAEARESYIMNRTEFTHFQDTGTDDPDKPWVWADVKKLRQHISENRASFIGKVKDQFNLDIEKGELSLIVGGPPCQGFSGIGHRRSYSVDKKNIPSNHLYEDMQFMIESLRPKIFLFENVRGLLSARWDNNSEKGSIWKNIRDSFKSHLGSNYIIGWHLVRAKEYGVPQNRPRVLMVGIRKDLNWEPLSSSLDEDNILLYDSIYRAGGLLPAPTLKPPSLSDLFGDLVDPNYTSGQSKTIKYPHKASSQKKSVQRYFRKDKFGKALNRKGAPVSEHEYSRHKPNIVEKFQYMIENDGQIHPEHQTKKFAQRLLPKEWRNDDPTITATSLPDDYVHFSQPRIPTVREWARLQFFPDWYEFAGNRTTGGVRRAGNPRENNFIREVPKYTQIGNAVPVRMANAIGNHFMSLIEKY